MSEPTGMVGSGRIAIGAMAVVIAIVGNATWFSAGWKIPLLILTALVGVPGGLVIRHRLLQRAAAAASREERRRLALKAYVAHVTSMIAWCPVLALEETMGLGEAVAIYAQIFAVFAAVIAAGTVIGSCLTRLWMGKPLIELYSERNMPEGSGIPEASKMGRGDA